MNIAKFADGKKFMNDNQTYETKGSAEEKMRNYESDGFEVLLEEEEGKCFLFTRREVKEVVVEQS